MSLALYLLVEGVTDATLVGKLLRVSRRAKPVERLDDLPESVRAWIQDGYKWPHNDDISRPSVPAPKLFVLPDGRLVALSNGEGINNMRFVAEADQVGLDLKRVKVSAFGVIGDADEGDRATRTEELVKVLRLLAPKAKALPTAAGQILPGPPALGVLVVPAGEGLTVDTVLDALGRAAYPSLYGAAADFIAPWLDPKGPHHGPLRAQLKELRKPAGPVKAQLAAMAALLKPMKPFSATLNDHEWVTEAQVQHSALSPLLSFLNELLP
jgi:hypothetical protein